MRIYVLLQKMYSIQCFWFYREYKGNRSHESHESHRTYVTYMTYVTTLTYTLEISKTLTKVQKLQQFNY